MRGGGARGAAGNFVASKSKSVYFSCFFPFRRMMKLELSEVDCQHMHTLT